MNQFGIRSNDPGSPAPNFQQCSCLDDRFALTNFRLIYSSRSMSRRRSLMNFLGRYRLHRASQKPASRLRHTETVLYGEWRKSVQLGNVGGRFGGVIASV
jgi:hypothetical protein